ncbi:DUF5362 family protein [Halomonas halocynthiae]|uniref:DUF5362 family protein n=1 Tax=Halomonas halocynthiae TaxID=176290 RepID=UPI0003F9396B|nr:DUF5362 family protein [Halomonas halocynthiae]
MEPVNQTPPTPPVDSSYVLRDFIEPLYRSRFWMQLLGVMLILQGVFIGISIIGLVVAWIPVWAGVVLFQATGAIRRGYEANDQYDIKHTMSKLRTYFLISGIMVLTYLVLIAGSFLLFGAGAIMGLGGMSSMHGY